MKIKPRFQLKRAADASAPPRPKDVAFAQDVRQTTITDPVYCDIVAALKAHTTLTLVGPPSPHVMPAIIGVRVRVTRRLSKMKLILIWWTQASDHARRSTAAGTAAGFAHCALTEVLIEQKDLKRTIDMESFGKSLLQAFADAQFGHQTRRDSRNHWWWRPSFDPSVYAVNVPCMEDATRDEEASALAALIKKIPLPPKKKS